MFPKWKCRCEISMDTLRIAHDSLRSKSYSLSRSQSDPINHIAVIEKPGREIKCCIRIPLRQRIGVWPQSQGVNHNPEKTQKTSTKEPLHIPRQVFNIPSNVHLVGSHLQFPFPCFRVLHQQLIYHTKHLFHDSILAQIVFALNRRQPQSLAVVSSMSSTQHLVPPRIKADSLRVT